MVEIDPHLVGFQDHLAIVDATFGIEKRMPGIEIHGHRVEGFVFDNLFDGVGGEGGHGVDIGLGRGRKRHSHCN